MKLSLGSQESALSKAVPSAAPSFRLAVSSSTQSAEGWLDRVQRDEPSPAPRYV